MERDYNEIIPNLKLAIADIANDITVVVEDIQKNNGVVKKGIMLKTGDEQIYPIIYLDDILKDYDENIDYKLIADTIINRYKSNQTPFPSDFINQIKEPGYVQHNILPVLLNYEKNRRQLEKRPHRRFFDLAITYILQYKDKSGLYGTVHLQHKTLDGLGATFTEEELYSHAISNLIDKCKVMSLNTFLHSINVDIEEIPEPPMYIVTNTSMCYGASTILCNHILDDVFDCEKIIVLPSSIHEVIAVPYDGRDISDYIHLVKDVNNNVLDSNEFLSDSAYLYDRTVGTIVKQF